MRKEVIAKFRRIAPGTLSFFVLSLIVLLLALMFYLGVYSLFMGWSSFFLGGRS